MMRIPLLTLLIGFTFTQVAEAVEFHPLESMSLDSTVPGVFQFDSLTIPVGVTVSLLTVEAGVTFPTAQFNISGDVLIEGSLLAPGWNLSLNLVGGFVSGPQSRIESQSLTLTSLGQSNLQIGGAIVLAGASLDLSRPPATRGDGSLGSGGVTLQAGAPVGIIPPPPTALAVGAGGTLNLLAPLSPSPLLVVTSGSGQGSELSVTSAPIPEPESYALMLAGLGLVGFAARGKR